MILPAAAGSGESPELSEVLHAALFVATQKLCEDLLSTTVGVLDVPRRLVQVSGGSMSKMRLDGLPVLMELGQLLNMRLLKAQALIHGALCLVVASVGSLCSICRPMTGKLNLKVVNACPTCTSDVFQCACPPSLADTLVQIFLEKVRL